MEKEIHDLKCIINSLEKWISVDDRLPNCFEKGDFDGLRSDYVLVINKEDIPKTARMYSGFMDGSEFNEFYSATDVEIGGVKFWKEINLNY